MNFDYCNGTIHVIEKGDTLYKLSREYGIPLALILMANPYTDIYNLQVGDEVCIPVNVPDFSIMPIPLSPQMPSQMQPQMPGQMQPQMPGQMQPQMPGQMQPQMPSQMQPQMPGQMQPQMPSQMQPVPNDMDDEPALDDFMPDLQAEATEPITFPFNNNNGNRNGTRTGTGTGQGTGTTGGMRTGTGTGTGQGTGTNGGMRTGTGQGTGNAALQMITYIVKENDSMESILNNFDIEMEDFLRYNNLGDIMLQPGTVLSIPRSSNGF